MSEKPILCVCGHRKGLHDNPGCEINGGCAGIIGVDCDFDHGYCPCRQFRPVLDWPNEKGDWFVDANFNRYWRAYANRFGGYIGLLICGDVYHYAREGWEKRFGKSKFTRCLEPNPFDH